MKNIMFQLEEYGLIILTLLIFLHNVCKMYLPEVLIIIKIFILIALTGYLFGVYNRKKKKNKIVSFCINIIISILIILYLLLK